MLLCHVRSRTACLAEVEGQKSHLGLYGTSKLIINDTVGINGKNRVLRTYNIY